MVDQQKNRRMITAASSDRAGSNAANVVLQTHQLCFQFFMRLPIISVLNSEKQDNV
jgi:hypothetical protein